MLNRWGILAILFIVRAIMAIQYQSVAGLAPLLQRDLGLDLTDVGILIGLYMAPGMILALPGGAIGRKLGDKTGVLLGLALMVAGGALMGSTGSWTLQIGGRLMAGVGGVLLSVLLSNMMADWFPPEEIGTATALLMISWPVGLALSLMVVPEIGASYSAAIANETVSGLAVIGFVLIAAFYHPRASIRKAVARIHLQPNSAALVVGAAIAYTLYVIGYGMVVNFAPSMLVERGWSMTEAGATTSIVIWIGVASTLVGGALADKTGRHNLISVASYLAFAVLLVMVPRCNSTILAFIALGIVSGLPIASVASLPVRMLAPSARPIGLGLFYTIFYCGMMVGPGLGGRYASWLGTADAVFDFGAMVVIVGTAMLCVVANLPAMVRSTAEVPS